MRHISPYEVYAKHMLETLYWDRYGPLLLRDKPDLQTVDGEAGIEESIVLDQRNDELIAVSIVAEDA